jgi:hypothetical protein
LKTLQQFKSENPEAVFQVVEKKYLDYRSEWQRIQSQQFFDEHKSEEWFKERYHPTYIMEREKQRIANLPKQISEFDEKFDFNNKSLWSHDYRDKINTKENNFLSKIFTEFVIFVI